MINGIFSIFRKDNSYISWHSFDEQEKQRELFAFQQQTRKENLRRLSS